MKQYLDALQLVLDKGRFKGDRTGTGTTSYFGHQMRFDLSEGFPLVTTKKVHLKSIVHELLWFLSGDTNIKYLLDNGVHIWDDWCIPEYKEEPLTPSDRYDLMETDYPDIHDEYLLWSPYKTEEEKVAWCKERNVPTTKRVLVGGELGPVYGAMWRRWPELISVYQEPEGVEEFDALIDKYQAMGYEYVGDNERGRYYFKREIDQIQKVIDTLRTNPTSRRIMVTGWNPSLMPIEGASHQENVENGLQALPPCHTIFQFYAEELNMTERIKFVQQNHPAEYERVTKQMCSEVEAGAFPNALDDADGTDAMIARNNELFYEVCERLNVPKYRLSCQLYQRSADMFLGVPFNIASYALLTMMMAQCVNMVPGDFIHTFGDMHVYSNHMEQVREQLSREPRPLPKMRINPEVRDLFSFKFEDFTLEDYDPHPAIKGQVAV